MNKQPYADASAPSEEGISTIIEHLERTILDQTKVIGELRNTLSSMQESHVLLVSTLNRKIEDLEMDIRNKDEELSLLRKKLFAPRSEKTGNAKAR